MAERDEGRVLSWAVRRYIGLVAVVAVLAVALSLLAAQALRRDLGYTATALVIATELQVRQEQLPRYGESVFNGGSVARAVATEASADFRSLVPDRISMDPVPDTIAFRVQGHADDPQEAARLANSAAEAFVAQLNKAGAGVGKFSLQDPAFVPLQRNAPLVGYPLAAVVGLTAGTVLGIVLLASYVGYRRPVLDGEQAAAAADAPLLAVVTFPWRGKGNVRGGRALLDALPGLPSTMIEVVGPPGSRRARRKILAELAAVAGARPVRPGDPRRSVTVTDLLDDRSVPLELRAHPLADESVAAVLLVVQEGAAWRQVVDVAEDFPPEEVAGTVFVRRRRRLRPEAGGAAPAAAAAPAGAHRASSVQPAL